MPRYRASGNEDFSISRLFCQATRRVAKLAFAGESTRKSPWRWRLRRGPHRHKTLRRRLDNLLWQRATAPTAYSSLRHELLDLRRCLYGTRPTRWLLLHRRQLLSRCDLVLRWAS
jgi:hypothetical protein